MHSSTDTGGEELLWVRAARSGRNFELRAGESVIARLEWNDRNRAIGSWAERHYKFKWKGWLRQRVLVYGGADLPPEGPLATFALLAGALTIRDGRRYTWTKPMRWTNERVWVDAAGGILARFSPSRVATTVTISPSVAEQDETRLLALLGQFLLVNAARDAEDAMVVVTTVVLAGGAG